MSETLKSWGELIDQLRNGRLARLSLFAGKNAFFEGVAYKFPNVFGGRWFKTACGENLTH